MSCQELMLDTRTRAMHHMNCILLHAYTALEFHQDEMMPMHDEAEFQDQLHELPFVENVEVER